MAGFGLRLASCSCSFCKCISCSCSVLLFPALLWVPWLQVNLEQGGELTCSLSNVIVDQLKQ